MATRTLTAALAGAIALAASTAQAAEMNMSADVNTGKHHNVNTIVVSGDFVAGDAKIFRALIGMTPHDNPIIVFLDDNHGGSLLEGLDIGNAIREAGARTAVTTYCYSACALAWLGGVERAVVGSAQVGFHAAYSHETHAVAAPANALLGYYIAHLGFGSNVALWATEAAPDSINMLTPAIAQQIHFEAKFAPVTPPLEPADRWSPAIPGNPFVAR